MIIRNILVITVLAGCANLSASEATNDLKAPDLQSAPPSAGKRVRLTLPEFIDTDLYHALYLPTNWEKGKEHPVIVEYAGNKYKDGPGTVESSNMGYGISGGKDVIWLCLPYVDLKNKRNATKWWGDLNATVEYCKKALKDICDNYGGNSDQLFIAGFSRGAIGCNYIGLHDDEIASLWRGFICHSHYDGVRDWGYTGADKISAARRLERLGSRPQFISHETSVNLTKAYLKKSMPEGNFTFISLPFPEHTDTWVLRDSPERQKLRAWFKKHSSSTDAK